MDYFYGPRVLRRTSGFEALVCLTHVLKALFFPVWGLTLAQVTYLPENSGFSEVLQVLLLSPVPGLLLFPPSN